ncbi:MAG: manganese efflux pump MntP family protein [bacterium]
MSILELFILSIALAMDAFAVSITRGIKVKDNLIKRCFEAGIYFGIFQGLMPIIGYFIGSNFQEIIYEIDQYIVFAILLIIGIKMLVEAFSDEECKNHPIIILAILTSIDALSVGVSFALLKVNIIFSSILIGIVTFILCFIGVKVGNIFGNKYKKKAELFGAIIIILIAIKILIESFI